MPFEKLNCSFVVFCSGLAFERAEISSLARLWILLSRVQPVPTGFHSFYHCGLSFVYSVLAGRHRPIYNFVRSFYPASLRYLFFAAWIFFFCVDERFLPPRLA